MDEHESGDTATCHVFRGARDMRFQIGDPVWVLNWHKLCVVTAVNEQNNTYSLNMSEFYEGWKNSDLQSCSMSAAGPVRNKRWRRNGHGGR